ncbi:hypothetical protein Tco_0052140 [Tanacetum coccineum]
MGGGVAVTCGGRKELCKMVVECQSVKVKEFQERCNIKAFQEWYEHVGPEVASPQGGKVTSWRRDYAWLMISRCSRSLCQIQVQGTSSIQEVNDHYNIFTRESQEYELKTKDKAYLGAFTEEEITDEFPDEHLMILKTELNDDEPWYADYVNYIVGKIVPPN